jgi:hypothetical protein
MILERLLFFSIRVLRKESFVGEFFASERLLRVWSNCQK